MENQEPTVDLSQPSQLPQPPQILEEKPKRKILKTVLIILAVLAIIAGLFITSTFWVPVVMVPFSKDLEHFDDSDLRFEKFHVLEEENAYYDLLAFGEPLTFEESFEGDIETAVTIYDPIDALGLDQFMDYISGEAWNKEFAEEVFNKNTEVYAIFDEAASKPYYQYPAIEDPENTGFDVALPPLNTLRVLSRADAIRALYLFKQGEEEAGIDEALKIVELGQKLQDSRSTTLIQYLIGLAVKETGLEVLQAMISDTSLSPDKLISYVGELEGFKNNEEGIENAFKAEYLGMASSIDEIVSNVKSELFDGMGLEEAETKMAKKSFYFQPNKTKKLHANDTRWLISNIEKHCSLIQPRDAERMEISEDFIGLIVDLLKLSFTENAIGEILYSIAGAPAFESVFWKKCNDDLLVSVDQLLFAIKAYQMESGDYPASLEELVPRYFDSVPIDPFDGKPTRYSFEKKILYSVGEDGVDSGGSEGDYWREMPDPTFNLPDKFIEGLK